VKLKNILLVAALLAAISLTWAQTAKQPVNVWNVIEARNQMARQDLWPGFDPSGIPVLIYDGTNSYLYGHPMPPEDFHQDSLHPNLCVRTGRHRLAVANTTDQLEGRAVAVICFNLADRQTVNEWAGVVLHESFHVFQAKSHRHWFANEMDFFTYPVTDSEAVALRRMETAALKRAVTAADENSRLAWAATALDIRDQRFARIGSSASDFERCMELTEGLAYYIEWQACREGFPETLPDSEYAVDQIRLRTYSTGRSIAMILDKCLPQWKMRLESDTTLYLDSLLRECIRNGAVPPAQWTTEFAAAARTKAADDCRAYFVAIKNKYESYIAKPGWTLIINARGDKRLWPQGFDPMNMQNLGEGNLLHRRFLKLGNQDALIEVMDFEALSRGAGSHPIGEGVKELIVTGIQQEPMLTKENGEMKVICPSIIGTFKSATIDKKGQTLTVTL